MKDVPSYVQLLITIGVIVSTTAYSNGQMNEWRKSVEGQLEKVEMRFDKVEESQALKMTKYENITGLLSDQNVRVVILEKDSESHHYRLTRLEDSK